MIIGISGLCIDSNGNKRVAGAGKDTVADILTVRRHVAKVALADPLKRICKQVYGFTYEQLWGPSQLRNTPDERYVRMKAGELGTSVGGMPNPREDVLLTPRHALQQLGTEWGRKCYDNTWIDFGIRTANQLMKRDTGKVYIDHLGVIDSDFIPSEVETEDDIEALEAAVAYYPEDVAHVAFSDVRFFNEARAIRAAGGKVVRVKRAMKDKFADPFEDNHQSERELGAADDDEFDYVLDNNSDLHTLKLNTLRMFDVLTGRIAEYDEKQENIPPFMRKKP